LLGKKELGRIYGNARALQGVYFCASIITASLELFEAFSRVFMLFSHLVEP
jgi:hypothetical protein